MIRLATADGLYRMLDAAEGDTNPGVLVDGERRRVFVGTPAVLRSLVVRLVLLDGSYDRHRFELMSSIGTVDGNDVQVWRVLDPPPPDGPGPGPE